MLNICFCVCQQSWCFVMSTKTTSPGILAPGKQGKHFENKWWDELGSTDTYKDIIDFFFLIDWEIACLFLLEWEFQTQQNKHKKLLGDADHKIITWDRNSVSCFYCTDSAQVERDLLTGVTQFDRHHIENGFLSYHRQRKYIFLFQERATRRGVMIFLSISDQLLGPWKCCYTDSIG